MGGPERMEKILGCQRAEGTVQVKGTEREVSAGNGARDKVLVGGEERLGRQLRAN